MANCISESSVITNYTVSANKYILMAEFLKGFSIMVSKELSRGIHCHPICKFRYLGGQLQIGEHRDKKLHGLCKQVHPDGRVVDEGVSKDGELRKRQRYMNS